VSNGAMTGPGQAIRIRKCRNLDELGACVDLQAEVWGFSDGEVVPRRAFVVASKIGGQVIGAFDTSLPETDAEGEAGTLIGFAMALPGFSQALPGVAAGEPYLHSHMLAVRPAYRKQGIGRRLKLFQREEALARGIDRMEWTFDPLEIGNASLNIARLGAIVRRYEPNLYGVSSSRLQGVLPTDRLYAEWWMGSDRVESIVSGKAVAPAQIEQTIRVPRAIGRWRQSATERGFALEVQKENREKFERAFDRGLAVAGFVIEREGDGIFQLGRWEAAFGRPSRALAHMNQEQAGIHED
jgi:predicted GNAT superfamily acetyltransferase